jgi:prepilin-type N-terminal cleavage/methylation domain-containing protein
MEWDHSMNGLHKDKQGFTLVEIIVSLVLMGILASMAGLGFVQAAKGFVFVQDNTQKAQTTQLAMGRLSKAITNWTFNSNLESVWLTPTSITLERKHFNDIIVETYQYNSENKTLTVSRDANNSKPRILAENIESLTFSYSETDKKTGKTVPWKSGKIANMVYVQVNLVYGGSNSGTTEFSTRVVPRNTYNPSALYLEQGSSGSTTPACFIETINHGEDNPVVILLRQFRNRVLLRMPGGKQLVDWYYKAGPDLVRILKNHDGGKNVTMVLLYPFVALAFLMLYYPVAFLFIGLMAWLMVRYLRRLRGRGMPRLNNQYGSAIMMVIAGMLLFSVLGAGIVSMTTSSMYTQVGYNSTNQAYHLAESGFRYSAYKYAKDMKDSTLVTLHEQGKVEVRPNNSFDVVVEPYWFNLKSDKSNVVESDCNFPTFFLSDKNSGSGYIYENENKTLHHYSGFSYNSNNPSTLTFKGVTGISGDAGTEVFLATRISGGQALSEGDSKSIKMEAGTLKAFPSFNGIVSIKTDVSGGGDTPQNETYYVLYDKKIGDKLIGLKKVGREKSLPFSVNNNDEVVLTKYVDLKSIGIVGSGPDPVTRTITYSQPLFKVMAYNRKEWSTNFDSPADVSSNFNTILGSHGHEVVEGDGALKVTGTSEEDYLSGWAVDIIPYKFEESVIGLDHTATDLGLYDAWSNSEKTLSYDLQAKIRFSKDDDKELNYLGTYMPGLSFRLDHDGANYYGLSILRGIPGYRYHFGVPGWREVKDDIPDTLFNDHGNVHESISHNDIKPIAGMPYLVLWQKAEKSFWNHLFGTGDSIEKYEWLSYLALCNMEVIDNLYYYPAGGSPVEESCGPCKWYKLICKACCANNNSDWPCSGYWDWESLPERGWFVGKNGAFPENKENMEGPFRAIKLTEKADLKGALNFEKVEIDGLECTFLGKPGHAVIRSSKNGAPIENAAFILPENPSSDFPLDDPGSFNYRIYPKNWTTIMARILEFKKDIDGDGDDDRCNAIQAWIAGTDKVARGEIKWPEDGNSLSHIIWDDYSSMELSKTLLGYPLTNKALLAKIDTANHPEIVYSAFFTTEKYPDNKTSWKSIPEVGLHTLGIDVRESTETVYFDDFSMAIYEGKAGLYAPVQSE